MNKQMTDRGGNFMLGILPSPKGKKQLTTEGHESCHGSWTVISVLL